MQQFKTQYALLSNIRLGHICIIILYTYQTCCLEYDITHANVPPMNVFMFFFSDLLIIYLFLNEREALRLELWV